MVDIMRLTNSAGVFRPEYAKNKELIWTEPATGNSVTTDTAESDTQSKSSNAIKGNAPQISSSESKGSDNVGDVQVEFRDKETDELMCEKNRDLNQKRWVNRCYLKIIGRLTAYATLNLLWVNNYW